MPIESAVPSPSHAPDEEKRVDNPHVIGKHATALRYHSLRCTRSQVMHSGDETEKKEGKPYWTGTKRKPNPVEYSPDDALCMEFLYAAANMHAFVFGVPPMRDRTIFESAVRALGLVQPDWKPSGEVVPEKDEEELQVDAGDLSALTAELQAGDGSNSCRTLTASVGQCCVLPLALSLARTETTRHLPSNLSIISTVHRRWMSRRCARRSRTISRKTTIQTSTSTTCASRPTSAHGTTTSRRRRATRSR